MLKESNTNDERETQELTTLWRNTTNNGTGKSSGENDTQQRKSCDITFDKFKLQLSSHFGFRRN